MSKKKITIIGSGSTGSTIAYALTIKNIGKEIVLVSRKKNLAIGEIMDINHGFQSLGGTKVKYGDFKDCIDSDLIIITVGKARSTDQTRMDLAKENIEIVREIINSMKLYYNDGIILVISNPVDLVTTMISQEMNLPSGKIFGTGTMLDTSRFVYKLASHFNVSAESVNALIIGEHGPGLIPLWSSVTICNLPIEDYCKLHDYNWNEEIKIEIENEIKNMGEKIIEYKGKTHFGIATSVSILANSIISGDPIMTTVSSQFEGDFGLNGISLSMPSIISNNGVERLSVINWDQSEHLKFQNLGMNLRNEYLKTISR